MIAEGLEKQQTFRRVMKQTVEKVMANRDVQGVRIALSGRLGGAEMSRQEEIKRGRVPLQTLRADIDYHRETSSRTFLHHSIQRMIGIASFAFSTSID
jgi:small subunit ribosomal protein S3